MRKRRTTGSRLAFSYPELAVDGFVALRKELDKTTDTSQGAAYFTFAGKVTKQSAGTVECAAEDIDAAGGGAHDTGKRSRQNNGTWRGKGDKDASFDRPHDKSYNTMGTCSSGIVTRTCSACTNTHMLCMYAP